MNSLEFPNLLILYFPIYYISFSRSFSQLFFFRMIALKFCLLVIICPPFFSFLEDSVSMYEFLLSGPNPNPTTSLAPKERLISFFNRRSTFRKKKKIKYWSYSRSVTHSAWREAVAGNACERRLCENINGTKVPASSRLYELIIRY